LLAIVLVLLLLTAAWIWWNQYTKVDMAADVPGDCLVYVESNSLADIASALMDTEAGRNLGPSMGMKFNVRRNNWLTSLARVTGIGSAQSVIAARSQVALVMLDLNSTASDNSLDFKPLAALVVETHTSTTRIKPAIEDLVGAFARRAFGQPSVERIGRDNNEFVKWNSPDGKRQIVASIDGSVAVVGNDERAVSACLAARRGQRPSLAHQADVEEIRSRVRANDALAFGYISSGNAARLLSEMAPALLGKLPEQGQLQKLLLTSSAKVLGSVGWSARPAAGSIEDYYFMSVKPALAERLQPELRNAAAGQHRAWGLLPANTYSVTNYNFADPAVAWEALNAAVSSQLDTLAAVFFTTISRASLAPYGIDEPDTFLRAIKPELLTARLDAASERSVVVAAVRDEAALRRFVTRQFGAKAHTERVGNNEIILSADERSAASFVDGFFMLGSPEDLRRCLSMHPGSSFSAEATSRNTAVQESANVVSYAQDGERIRGLLTTMARVRGSNPSVANSADVERMIEQLPYAVTETKLEQQGLVRRTRSPLGQFSSLVSLLSPDQTH